MKVRVNHLLTVGLFSVALGVFNICQAASPTPSPSAFNDQQVKQLQQIIHDYIVKNPQVLVEASQVLQQQEMAKAKSKTQQAVAKNTKALFNAPNSPTIGNHNGDVTLIEFLDYQCAHCKEMSGMVESLIKGDTKLRIVIKELPIFGGSSKYAAQASIAAIKQGQDKFIAFHKGLLQTNNALTNEKIIEVAKKAGLDTQRLEADMKNKAVEDQINDNFRLAQELGLLGTPAFIVANRNGSHVEYIPGSVNLDTLQQTITQIRKK